MSFGFHKPLEYNLIIITGACRTGKTTFAKTLAQQLDADFLDEPWTPLYFPTLLQFAKIDRTLALGFMRTYFNELCNDIILYRRANFRAGDQSSLWHYESAEDIMKRLVNVRSREDVRAIAGSNKKIILSLPETTHFAEFFAELGPSVFTLLMTREGKSLAQEITEKAWYSDTQLLAPINNQPFHKVTHHDRTWFVPWWVPESQFHEFIEGDEALRAALYQQVFDEQASKLCNRMQGTSNFSVLDFAESCHSIEAAALRVKDQIETYYAQKAPLTVKEI